MFSLFITNKTNSHKCINLEPEAVGGGRTKLLCCDNFFAAVCSVEHAVPSAHPHKRLSSAPRCDSTEWFTSEYQETGGEGEVRLDSLQWLHSHTHTHTHCAETYIHVSHTWTNNLRRDCTLMFERAGTVYSASHRGFCFLVQNVFFRIVRKLGGGSTFFTCIEVKVAAPQCKNTHN